MTRDEWIALHRDKWGLSNRKKVAIVGFCGTSRDLTRYDDPSFEIWGLNRGYLFMERADRWFEMHGQNIYQSQQRRPGRHVDYLNAFKGPVYMHQSFEDVTTCVVFPLQELSEFLGVNVWRQGKAGKGTSITETNHFRDTTAEPYLSSSIAYELALAIWEGFEEIHLLGVDLNTESEYAWQKPGVEFLLGIAAGMGIRVVLPDNCPLLKGPLYGRSFLSEKPEQMTYDQMARRLAALQHDAESLQVQMAQIQGAHTELTQFVQPQMVPGVDHERLEDRRKQMEKQLQEMGMKLNQVGGAIQETAYWLHQTYGGQEPAEAMAQLKKLDDKQFVAEGPITELEMMQHRNGHEAIELVPAAVGAD